MDIVLVVLVAAAGPVEFIALGCILFTTRNARKNANLWYQAGCNDTRKQLDDRAYRRGREEGFEDGRLFERRLLQQKTASNGKPFYQNVWEYR